MDKFIKGTITKLSAYGFYLDHNHEWFACDAKLVKSQSFQSLKIGDLLSDIIYGDSGFVISFSSNASVLPKAIKPSQCLISREAQEKFRSFNILLTEADFRRLDLEGKTDYGAFEIRYKDGG